MRYAALLFSLLSAACATRPEAPVDRGLDITRFHRTDPQRSLVTAIGIPVLKSPALEKRWGAPEVTFLTDGTYRLEYRPHHSFESLTIYGMPGIIDSDAPAAPPAETIGRMKNGNIGPTARPQEWKTVTILGKRIHHYEMAEGTGADPLNRSTVTFPIEQASYRLIAQSNKDDAEVAIESYFRTVEF